MLQSIQHVCEIWMHHSVSSLFQTNYTTIIDFFHRINDCRPLRLAVWQDRSSALTFKLRSRPRALSRWPPAQTDAFICNCQALAIFIPQMRYLDGTIIFSRSGNDIISWGRLSIAAAIWILQGVLEERVGAVMTSPLWITSLCSDKCSPMNKTYCSDNIEHLKTHERIIRFSLIFLYRNQHTKILLICRFSRSCIFTNNEVKKHCMPMK